MAFEQIEKGYFARRTAINNRVAVSSAGKGAISFIVSNDIFKAMGSPQFVHVGIGSGTNAGQILVKPAPSKDGAYKMAGTGAASIKNSAKKFALSPARVGLKNMKRSTTPIRFEMTKNGLVIWLPQ